MQRKSLIQCLAIALCSLATSPAFAVLSMSFVSSQSTYTPGDTFTVQLKLNDFSDLNFLDVEVKLSAGSGTAGIDFGFFDATTAPANYVFTGKVSNGFAATASDDGTDAFLLISDFLDGVDILSSVSDNGDGTNDVLAEFEVFTSGDVGDLTFSVDFFELLDPDFAPIPGADTLSPGGLSLTPEASTVIPEPTGLAMWALLSTCVVPVLSRRRKRRQGG